MPVHIRLPRFLYSMMDKLVAASGLQPQPGETIHPPAALTLTRRTLLYFKAEACVGCDQMDLYVARLATTARVDLRVIDARRGDLPEHAYGDQLLLDSKGDLRKHYRVRAFPTLVVTRAPGDVVATLVGAPGDETQIRASRALT